MLSHMATAEMRNAIAAYKAFIQHGYSEEDALRLTEQVTRETQNPSTAAEESGVYTVVKQSGLGAIFMFMGQPTVSANLLLRAIQEGAHDIRNGDTAKASRELTVTVACIVLNTLFATALSYAIGIMSRGLLDDLLDWLADEPLPRSKERDLVHQNELTVVRLASELGDQFLPLGGRISEMVAKAIVKIQEARTGAQAARGIEEAWGEMVNPGQDSPLYRSMVNLVQSITRAPQAIGEGDLLKMEKAALQFIDGAGFFFGLPVGGTTQLYRLGRGALTGSAVGEEIE